MRCRPMVLCEILTDSSTGNQYEITYDHVYHIPQSSPAEIKVARVGSTVRKEILSAIVMEGEGDNGFSIARNPDAEDLSKEIMSAVADRIASIDTWRQKFNSFVEENDWWITQELRKTELIAQVFEVCRLLEAAGFRDINAKPGFLSADDVQQSIEVSGGRFASVTVCVSYTCISITAKIIRPFGTVPILISIDRDSNVSMTNCVTSIQFNFSVDAVIKNLECFASTRLEPFTAAPRKQQDTTTAICRRLKEIGNC